MKTVGPRPYILGVDESGTGAYAGPFTVSAFMSRREDTPWIYEVGARDSKSLTRIDRARLAQELAPCAIIAETVAVKNDYTDQPLAWRKGVIRAIEHCISAVSYDPALVSIYIDGSHDNALVMEMNALWRMTPYFQVRGDATIPQVSAASIYAKHTRSQIMLCHHDQYPVYGWERNDGYGTKDHRAAIEEHGICELHRRIRPLRKYWDPEYAKQLEKKQREEEIERFNREANLRYMREHSTGDHK